MAINTVVVYNILHLTKQGDDMTKDELIKRLDAIYPNKIKNNKLFRIDLDMLIKAINNPSVCQGGLTDNHLRNVVGELARMEKYDRNNSIENIANAVERNNGYMYWCNRAKIKIFKTKKWFSEPTYSLVFSLNSDSFRDIPEKIMTHWMSGSIYKDTVDYSNVILTDKSVDANSATKMATILFEIAQMFEDNNFFADSTLAPEFIYNVHKETKICIDDLNGDDVSACLYCYTLCLPEEGYMYKIIVDTITKKLNEINSNRCLANDTYIKTINRGEGMVELNTVSVAKE